MARRKPSRTRNCMTTEMRCYGRKPYHAEGCRPAGSCSMYCNCWCHIVALGKETQYSISRWATDTFGKSGTTLRVAIRANEEMSELLRALSVDDRSPKAAEEVADIFIVLYRVAERLGVEVAEEVEKKMAVNRKRKWKLDGTGHGYHVRNKGVKP